MQERAPGSAPTAARNGADQAIGDRRLPRLPRRRQKAEIVEVAPDDGLRHDAGRLPGKWGLKADYPMVAPNYALKRQELAEKIGLGRKRSIAPVVPEPKAKRSRAKAAAA